MCVFVSESVCLCLCVCVCVWGGVLGWQRQCETVVLEPFLMFILLYVTMLKKGIHLHRVCGVWTGCVLECLCVCVCGLFESVCLRVMCVCAWGGVCVSLLGEAQCYR